MLTTQVDLNVCPGGIPPVIHVSQYDAGTPRLELHLVSDNGEFTLPSGAQAEIRGTKPDGNGFSYSCNIMGTSVVVVNVTEQMTAAAGKVICEIALYTGTPATEAEPASQDFTQLCTANFVLYVERAALDKDTLKSGSEIRQLVTVIDRTDELLAAAQTMDDAKQTIQDMTDTTRVEFQEMMQQAEEDATALIELATESKTEAKKSEQNSQRILDAVQEKGEQISRIALTSDELARTALEKATNAENESAEAASKLDRVSDDVDAAIIQLQSRPDDAFVENGVAYFTSGGEVLFTITGLGGGGGSGGGGSAASAQMDLKNTSGWLMKTISQSDECQISFRWSSIENEMETGPGSMRIEVNNLVRTVVGSLPQGDNTVNVSPYLSTGANKVAIYVSDTYGTERVIRATVIVAVFELTSSLDVSTPFTGVILVPYTPTGSTSKTMHFILDDVEIGTAVTSVSGRQQSYTIPKQSHGAHSLRMYFEAELNGQTVRSNELYFEITCIDPLSTTPVITSSFHTTSAKQYSTISIPYTVYNPAALTTAITINVNDEPFTALTVDRTVQTFSYRVESEGELKIEVVTGQEDTPEYAHKIWNLTIDPVNIDVEAETEGLALYLSSSGRSNAEAAREEWKYNDISAVLSGFNWRINGWMTDGDGVTVLRLNDTARVEIPYKIFGNDFKEKGKTIELEFATRDVVDYDATILSCMSGGVGLRITPQAVYFNGAQTNISTLYKENEHIRLSITVGKQSEYRLILIYINGLMSRAIQYAAGERFSQLEPVGISIGSDVCGIDLYTIRVYDQDLNDKAIVENWIADTQVGSLMQDRYNRNHVYSESGDITIATLPGNLPYMLIEGTEQPQYKGDKKIVSGRYVDPVDGSKSFSFSGCQINVQGTSSAIYYRKNWDLQYKEGFTMANGATAGNYALHSGSIPFNRFVLKADVASSESANNTGLTMLYNEVCPYKTPEMEEDSRVRWGIEGIPIVLFWYNPDTGETEFLGKHNFNLPKRAPQPYGYTGNDESWEFERNNSDNVKFKSFDVASQTWDEVEQKYYPTWYDDWEARFPSDEWRNTAKLGEFVQWVVGTDRTQATNELLPTPVEYTVPTRTTLNAYGDDTSYTVEEIGEGSSTRYKITFTKDTPAYRLTKFRAEAADYMELTSFEFYYIFTTQFLMIDSWAKNMFIGSHGSAITDKNRAMDRKMVAEPYDMDTAIGTNNSGVLMFGFSLEDTDTVSAVISGESGSDAPVFNAQDSVLWTNMRDAFRGEIASMYRTLRTGTKWNYNYIKTWFENHQSKWSEAIFNEDARTKYLIPLTNPVTVDDETGQLVRTDRYLTMLQGSKSEQRKWWLYNRFRYMDSKYNTGDASKTINMRLFNGGTLRLTPAIDLYVGVSFGGGTTPSLKRTTAETTAEFIYEAPSGVTEMETWIYSADLIADVGDLSIFYPNELDFSRATRLRRLKIGSGEEGYANNNLTTLDVRNSGLLEYIDCRNCPRLAITVNLEGSPRLKEAYFDGTAITGVELADGATIEKLHLPDTITTLTLINLNKLTELQLAGVSNVTRLMLSNMDSNVIDAMEIVQQLPANSQIYIDGLSLEMADSTEISAFLDFLDTMKGVTRERAANGEWAYHEHETAQVSGHIHTTYLTGAEIAAFNNRYPYIDVTADHTTSMLYYHNWEEGSAVIHSETIIDGANGTYTGRPSHASTAQYNFNFLGWNRSPKSRSADSDACKNVTADRHVYAAYSLEIRKYTVTFSNPYNTADNATVQNVAFGSSTSYPKTTTPTCPENEAMVFSGWSPEPTGIQGNTTCVAQFMDTSSPLIQYLNGNITEYESDTNTVAGAYAFYSRSKMVTIRAPFATVGTSCFSLMPALKTLDISAENIDAINMYEWFGSNKPTNLETFILRSRVKPAVTNPYYAPSSAVLYVRPELLEAYQADSNYSKFTIKSIDELPSS